MSLEPKITIVVAGEVIELRPCLSYALALERRKGSFAQLAREVLDGSLSAACEIIRPHTSLHNLEARVLPELDVIGDALLAYVLACAGIDTDEKPEPARPAVRKAPKAKSMPFDSFLLGLYRIATGWLGWPPAIALAATPKEIMEAHIGRMDMLKAVYGSADDPAPTAQPLTDDRTRNLFRGLSAVKVIREE